MNQLFQIATKVSTPLALGGLVTVVIFFILRQMLAKGIFKPVSGEHTFLIFQRLLTVLCILGVVAIILGFLGFLVEHQSTPTPPAHSESSEGISERRRDIRKFIQLHVKSPPAGDMEAIEEEEKTNGQAATLFGTIETGKADEDFAKAFNEYITESLATTMEREVSPESIKQALAFDATPQGQRALEGYKKIAARMVAQKPQPAQSATKLDRTVAQGNATDDELSRLTEPKIPPYMEELFRANAALCYSLGSNGVRELPRGVSPDNAALRRNIIITRNIIIERLSKLIEEEFSLDEIKFQTQFYEEHPQVAQLMAEIPRLMDTAMKNPDPIAKEKLDRELRKMNR